MMVLPEDMSVYDDVFTVKQQDVMYGLACNSFYRITGWRDAVNFEHMNYPNIHSAWSLEDLQNSRFIEEISKNASIKDFIGDRQPTNIVINLSHPGDTYRHHVHPGSDVILYYLNMEWRREWGGETLFYDPSGKEITYAVEVKPNRAITFDGEIPHTIRPATYAAPKFRITMAIVFSKPQTNAVY